MTLPSARFLITLLLVLVTACKNVQPVFNQRFASVGGMVEISIVSIDEDTALQALSNIKEDFAYLDKNWRVGGGGELDMVNKLIPAQQIIAIPPSLLPLIKLAGHLSASSRGTFNAATGKLFGLWGFHAHPRESYPPPSEYAITELIRANPRMSDLRVNGLLLYNSNSQSQLDLRGLLNGYGVDLAIARLRELGIHSASVKLGGITRVIGSRDGQPWRIPIHTPAHGGIRAFINLADGESIATLGGGERSFLYRSQQYHELLDPRTGHPARHTKAVGVLYSNAVTADAAAHALFVAGPKDWVQTAQAMELNKAFLVDMDGTIHMTSDMESHIKIVGDAPPIKSINIMEPDLK